MTFMCEELSLGSQKSWKKITQVLHFDFIALFFSLFCLMSCTIQIVYRNDPVSQYNIDKRPKIKLHLKNEI